MPDAAASAKLWLGGSPVGSDERAATALPAPVSAASLSARGLSVHYVAILLGISRQRLRGRGAIIV